jgi:predicted nucleic acid-binding protein
MPAAIECALDANIILRFVLGDNPGLAAKARAVFKAMEDGKAVLACDPVNLAEAVWVLSSYYKAPCADIADALLPLVKAAGFRMPDKDRYVLALELFGQGTLRFGDACACATAITAGGGCLISFDRRLSNVRGIRRVETVS